MSAPNPPPPDLATALANLGAQVNALGAGQQGAGIGLAKGQKQIGIRPGERGVDIPYGVGFGALGGGPNVTQYGTTVNPLAHAYQPGDEQNPGSGTPDQILRMQQNLVNAGLLNPKQVRVGFWDSHSAAAYKIVLAFANVHGMNATDAMNVFLSNPALQSTTRTAADISPGTNPDQIAMAVSQNAPGSTNTAQSLIGENLSPTDTADFVKQYQNQETLARQSLMDAQLSGNQSSYQAPDLQTAAADYIKTHELGKQVAYGTASRMLDFFQLLKGVPGL